MHKVLDFCFQQSIDIKKQIVLKILQKDHIHNAGALEVLLPKLVSVIQESKSKDFVKLFLDFFAKQFENNVSSFVWSGSGGDVRFKVIDKFIKNHGKVGEMLFEKTRSLLAKQDGETKKYVLLYFSLILCLYNRDGAKFAEMISFLPPFEKQEMGSFFGAIRRFAVENAVLPDIHKHIVSLYTKTCRYDTNFAHDYLHAVKVHGTDQWKYGKPAEEQGTAFAKYVFNLFNTEKGITKDEKDKEDEWAMWRDWATSKEYYKTWDGTSFSTNKLWILFGINVSNFGKTASALEKKNAWKHIGNIRKMLNGYAMQPRRYWSKIMGLPTWWDRWCKIVTLMSLVITTLVVILLIIGLFTWHSANHLSNISAPNSTKMQQNSEDNTLPNPQSDQAPKLQQPQQPPKQQSQ